MFEVTDAWKEETALADRLGKSLGREVLDAAPLRREAIDAAPIAQPKPPLPTFPGKAFPPEEH